MNKEIRQAHFKELINDMPLKDKIIFSKTRIKEFLEFCKKENEKEILVSFSGGKDSTVLLNLVCQVVDKEFPTDFKIIPAYAMEITFPETIKFIKETITEMQKRFSFLANILLVQPKKPWKEILHNYGFPIFSKQISVLLSRARNATRRTQVIDWVLGIKPSKKFRIIKKRLFLLDKDMNYYIDENGNKKSYYFSERCCDYVKGGLKHEKRPNFVGTMASESEFRKKSWIDYGCNIFEKNALKSRPLSIWNSSDVWNFVKQEKIKMNPCYQFDGEKPMLFNRLGCSACPLGVHLETHLKNKYNIKNRFEKLKDWNYNLYISQVKKTGMENILLDMEIKIENDDEYMKKFEIRQKQIAEWYANFRENLFKIMIQLENGKKQKESWEFSFDDFSKALKENGENENLTEQDKLYIYIYIYRQQQKNSRC